MLLRLALLLSTLFIVTYALPAESIPHGAKPKGAATVEPSEENFNTGLARLKSEDVEGAIDSFLQAIYFSRNGYNPKAYYMLGLAYKMAHQDGKAIEALKKHLEQTVDASPDGRILLAEVYLRNDRDKEAENEIKNALVEYRGPGPKAHNLYAMLLMKRKDWSSAEWHLMTALGDPPWTFTDAWMNLAQCQLNAHNWAGALRQYRAMLNSQKVLEGLDYEKVYLNMGYCYLAKGDHQDALDSWHQVLNYNHDNADAHLQLAMLLDVEKHISSALKEYKEFIRLKPENDPRAVHVKERMGMLGQQLGPAEVEPQAAMPSPYMRVQQDQANRRAQEQMRREQQEQEKAAKTPPPDSGF